MLLNLFSHSNLWIVRNKYRNERKSSFTNIFGSNIFGLYFEKYVEEILQYCLKNNCYQNLDNAAFINRIEVNKNRKIANWLKKLGDYNFIFEQKSTLVFLEIQQTRTDLSQLETFIKKTLGKAIRQLHETEYSYKLENAIKIILVYDSYFVSEAIDEVYKLISELDNDGFTWLVNIDEFEQLMYLYKTNVSMFIDIVREKIELEVTKSAKGKSFEQLFEKHGISLYDYIIETNIINEFNSLQCFETNI